MNIGVLGAGTWGMALARMLSNSDHRVTVWSALPHEIETYSKNRRHPNLPGMVIPDAIRFTCDIEEVCKEKDLILFAVPSLYVRNTAAKAAPHMQTGQIAVNVAKGIEADTLMTLTEIMEEEFEKTNISVPVVALSGPTHAEEVALDLPTTIVAACEDQTVAETVQDIFMNTCMRVYTNNDVLGVELCGALKNIVALASGMSIGLGYGDNAKAAIITRGMAEITRLGIAMGCNAQTFAGLAGVGDLIVTATSMHSRNNRAGKLIGSGYSPKEATSEVGMVVEGINALPAAVKLAQKYQIEMPIVSGVHRIVFDGAKPADEVAKLMQREKKHESRSV